jgi:hypothetical protein
MLEAPIRSRRWASCLTIALLTIFSSCATEKPHTALINDPDSQAESSIPWNTPKKWETGANLPGGLGGGGVGPVGSDISN